MDLTNDTPVWRILKHKEEGYVPVLYAWYTGHEDATFLTEKTFGTAEEAETWLKEFWQAYWRLGE
jgi:hypothetical protein